MNEKMPHKPDVLSEDGIRAWLQDVRDFVKAQRDQGLRLYDRRVDNYDHHDSLPAGTKLQLPLGEAGPWTLTSIICVVPAAATSATLIVKDRKIPVQSTPFLLGPVSMLVDAHDEISIVCTGVQGPVFLEAMGFENGPLT